MTETRYVDPVLLAVSDCLMLTALERASSRVISRSDRAKISQHQRHRAYERVPIHVDRVEYALTGAWALCPLLAARHRLPVDHAEWAELLDSYARALIVSCQPHSTMRLAPWLAPLASVEAGAREFEAVTSA